MDDRVEEVKDTSKHPKFNPKKVYEKKEVIEAPEDGPAPEVKLPQVFSISNFSELPLNNKLKEILAEKGFETLTAV